MLVVNVLAKAGFGPYIPKAIKGKPLSLVT